jgi:hypothetical protein
MLVLILVLHHPLLSLTLYLATHFPLKALQIFFLIPLILLPLHDHCEGYQWILLHPADLLLFSLSASIPYHPIYLL